LPPGGFIYNYLSPTGQYTGMYPSLGGTIPAGSTLVSAATFSANKAEIRNGSINYTLVETVPQGTAASVPVTYRAGDVLQQNSYLAVPIRYQAVNQFYLSADLLSGGFSSYDIHGDAGVVLGKQGADIHLTMPLLQLTAASYGVATGSDPSTTLGHFL